MLKTTLLSAFAELPAEFERKALISCIQEIRELECEIQASGRSETITVDEIKKIVKLHFKQGVE